MSRHDVAIYAPQSSGNYDRQVGRSGGAERQMTLLAGALSARGYRVAHVVFSPQDPIDLPEGSPTLVERGPYAGDRAVLGRLLETIRAYRALRAADGQIVVVREASAVVALAAVFARTWRRRLVFSSASDLNFVTRSIKWPRRTAYGLGVRLADVVVVQSERQVVLARDAFPSLRHVVHIPSFVEASSNDVGQSVKPGSFLWIGQVVSVTRPLRYLELARAVPEARFAMIPRWDRRTLGEAQAIREAAESIPNLEVLDPVPHEQLMSLMGRCVAVVNTSTLEGMPNVFLEAWAHGIPVLSLEFDPDQIIARRALGIAAAGSWDRFVAGARELWEGRFEREELSRRTRAYVEEVHSMEAVAARWDELVGALVRGD